MRIKKHPEIFETEKDLQILSFYDSIIDEILGVMKNMETRIGELESNRIRKGDV